MVSLERATLFIVGQQLDETDKAFQRIEHTRRPGHQKRVRFQFFAGWAVMTRHARRGDVSERHDVSVRRIALATDDETFSSDCPWAGRVLRGPFCYRVFRHWR